MRSIRHDNRLDSPLHRFQLIHHFNPSLLERPSLLQYLNDGFRMTDLLQNLIVYLGPNEGFRVLVVEPNELFNCRDQFRPALEDTSWDQLAHDFSKRSHVKTFISQGVESFLLGYTD